MDENKTCHHVQAQQQNRSGELYWSNINHPIFWTEIGDIHKSEGRKEWIHTCDSFRQQECRNGKKTEVYKGNLTHMLNGTNVPQGGSIGNEDAGIGSSQKGWNHNWLSFLSKLFLIYYQILIIS